MVDCCCHLDHKKVSNWKFTISFEALLRVSQRNPLLIGMSNTLFVCPFKFWVRAELVRPKRKRAEKFRIILCCDNRNNQSELPLSTFRYAFILRNWNKRRGYKEHKGTWYYPKRKELYWHPITYAQLINSQNNWIDDNNDVTVQIELVKLA